MFIQIIMYIYIYTYVFWSGSFPQWKFFDWAHASHDLMSDVLGREHVLFSLLVKMTCSP